MNKLKVAAISSTEVSWRDEITSSNDIRSEGLEKLKEAIRSAKSCGSSANELQDATDGHTKATACGI
jgi:hypothetical protein